MLVQREPTGELSGRRNTFVICGKRKDKWRIKKDLDKHQKVTMAMLRHRLK